jgi:hypothetical protein
LEEKRPDEMEVAEKENEEGKSKEKEQIILIFDETFSKKIFW